MRVLVISDTHIPTAAKKLPKIIEDEAKKSDYCLHAGDFITFSVFQTLNTWTKTYGVRGNMDTQEIKKQLSNTQIIKVEDITIGLIHGAGHPDRLISYIQKEFFQDFDKIDIFVFGHSHQVFNKMIDKKIYFNPGSPTDKLFASYRSYGILNITGANLKREIKRIE